MADISLKDYQNKLERLLVTGTTDEVIHHCRHILQYYPKNVVAYRILGRALVNGTGVEEAGEIFRRVLGVYPDDYTAHVGLSDVYHLTGKPNESIWHMERAYEQDPNNKTNIDRLRDLYRQYRQVDYARLQLTTGAVARQYLRNGLYAQAVETIKDTLQQSPNRADLRLLMAQTLWDSGEQVEAAEAALDVLKELPDCLEANRILTLLWLTEGRPSDAQRYLGHIEAVDPYLAMEIATNNTVPNNAFMLPEVDYSSIAQRRLATSEPDWLSEINTKSSTTADDWMSSLSTKTEEPVVENSYSTAVPDDWLQQDEPVKTEDMNDLFAGIQREGVPAPKATGGLTGLLASMENTEEPPPDLFDFDTLESEVTDEDDTLLTRQEMPDWLASAAPAEISEEQEEPLELEETPDLFDFDMLESELAEEDDALATETEMPDWLAEAAPAQAVEPQASLELEDPDPLAWLQDDNIETAEPLSQDFFADDEEMAYSDADDVDALAWLQDSGVEIVENPPVQDFFADEGEMVYQDPGAINPLAWLEDSGVEISQSETILPEESPALPQEKVAYSEPKMADPLAWLENSGIELVDSSDEDFKTISSMLEAQPDLDSEDDSFDWLKEDSMLDEMLDIENLADASESTSQVAASAIPTVPPIIEDFFASSDENDEDDEDDENEVVQNDWKGRTDILAGSRSFDELAQTDDSADNVATISDGQIDMSDQNDNQLPDWLDSESSESESETSGFEWLNTDSSSPSSSLPDDNSMDWMADLSGEQASEDDEPASEEQPASADSGWLIQTEEVSELARAETPDWLTDLAPSTEGTPAAENSFDWLTEDPDEPKVEPTQNVPDWLTEAAPELEDAQPVPVSSTELSWLSDESDEPEVEPTASTEFEWLSSEADEEPEAAVAADADWLGEIAPTPEAEAVQAEPVIGSDFEWLSSETDEEPEAEIAADIPDWLGEAAPAAEIEPEAVSSTEFEWLSDESDEEQDAVAANIPDWLGEAAPAAEIEPEAVSSTEFEWLSGENDEEQDAVAADADWLSEIAPSAEGQPEAAVSTEFEWLSSEADEEPEAAVAADADWLGEIAPTSEAEAVQAEPVIGSDFEWLSSETDEEPEAEIATEIPDWLGQAAPAAEIEPEAVSSTEFEWLSSDANEEPETEIAADIPDWLGQAAPAAEAETEAVSSTEFEWLSDDTDEEQAAVAADADWLGEIAPTAETEAVQAEPVMGSDFEWLSSEANEEPETEIAADIPDWLGEAAPAAEAQPEAVANTEFEWLSSDANEEPETETAADTPDWLGEIAPTAEAEAVQAEPVIGSDFEWLSSDAEELEAESLAEAEAEETLEPAGNIPDWLANASPVTEIESIQEDSSSDWVAETDQADFGKTRYLEEPAESEFGWLGETESAEEAAMAEGEAEAAYAELTPYDQQTMFGSVEDDEIERAMASANAPPPAENAPDWLNAMVPGLDLDYEATEDEPLDAAYVESAQKEESKSRDFDWLVRMVDEETGPVTPIREMAETAEAAPRRRFTFKRQPAWLRTPTEGQGSDATTNGASDNDFELPDWLQ